MLNESSNLLCLQKYIIKTVVQFFSNPLEVVTSRYVLYFDSKDNIIDFERELRKYIGNSVEVNLLKAKLGDQNMDVEILPNYLIYNDDQAVEHEATQLKITNGSVERIIVFIPDYDKDGIQLGDAFKNNIRNKFVDECEDKILFYLSVQNIASVSKTTENFQRQGMPLSVNNVYEYLYSQVNLVQGDNQKKVLCYSLDKINSNKPQNDNSLLEFAPIIRIIESQQLLEDDFHDLHMFPMSLIDLGKNDCNLAENYRLFRKISLALEDQELDSAMSSFEPGIIKQLQKSYDTDESSWDKKFTFEGIEKYKKVNTKKFKLEQPIVLLDGNDNVLSKEYYLDYVRGNSASFIIFTKDFCDEKVFKIQIRFTQKANIDGTTEFVVEQTNSRGNAYKIILDKTDNFYNGKVKFVGGKKSEFKPDFVKATNATILKPYHLPFNPLTLTQAKVFKPLLPIHTANAFKDTLSKIYNLGPKQQDTLLHCINETYSLCGIKPADKESWTNEAPTFEQVYQRYANDEEIKKNDSLAAAMNKLHQFEVFEANPSETRSLFDILQGVVVIDLSGYDSDIQSLIVAITLDLFYAQMQAAGSSKMENGLRQLTKMILVDEADNFMREGFPALKKILKEGREFGVGTILSTQFLKHFGSGEDDYSKYILTWIVHNVSDLKGSDVDFVFNTEAKSQDSNALFNQIKALKIHHSIIKIGTSKPIYLRDKAFWELYQEMQQGE